MSSILFYIDPDEYSYQEMVQLAADLVECLTFQSESFYTQFKTIGILAEPTACLEIGLSMLGRGETRTVENGERRSSPLKLYPFISDRGRESGEIGLIRPVNDDQETFGTLDDLVAFGAVESDPDFPFENSLELNSNDILSRVMQRSTWQRIVAFTSKSLIEVNIEKNHILFVNSESTENNQRKVTELLGLLEPIENELLGEIRRKAINDAIQFESIFKQLQG
jgi:hypothetical protein